MIKNYEDGNCFVFGIISKALGISLFPCSRLTRNGRTQGTPLLTDYKFNRDGQAAI